MKNLPKLMAVTAAGCMMFSGISPVFAEDPAVLYSEANWPWSTPFYLNMKQFSKSESSLNDYKVYGGSLSFSVNGKMLKDKGTENLVISVGENAWIGNVTLGNEVLTNTPASAEDLTSRHSVEVNFTNLNENTESMDIYFSLNHDLEETKTDICLPLTIKDTQSGQVLYSEIYSIPDSYVHPSGSILATVQVTDAETGQAITSMNPSQNLTATITYRNTTGISFNMMNSLVALNPNLELIACSSNISEMSYDSFGLGTDDLYVSFNFNPELITETLGPLPQTIILTLSLKVKDGAEPNQNWNVYLSSANYSDSKVTADNSDSSTTYYSHETLGWDEMLYISSNKSEWKKFSGSWYYYVNGTMLKADSEEFPYWLKDPDNGNWYTLDTEGKMITSKWVPYKEADGSVTWNFIGSGGGVVKQRWIKRDGSWVYLGQNGTMLTNRWIKSVDGYTYYVGSDGIMVTDAYINGYYVDKDGRWVE